MNDETLFLQAIADHPADDAARLVYADWLEERGDLRGEFLRLQHEFSEQALEAGRYRELCAREQELVPLLDPVWLQRVRRYSTAAPCRDLAELVPELRPFARTTTRLHPHRAVAPLPVGSSKIGGRFLWPESEPWPVCPQCHIDLAPVLQLRSRDVPDVEFPANKDLMQLFWCPDEEAHDYNPAPQIYWRNGAEVRSPRGDDPDLSEFPRRNDWEGYVPFECAVSPERVLEYPLGDDLYHWAGGALAANLNRQLEELDLGVADDLEERFRSEYGPSDQQGLAFYELGECPGSKVGGKPGGDRDGRRFDHLVTLSTWEFDSASFRRWLAVEDQRLLAPPGEKLTWSRLFQEVDRSRRNPLQEVLGMQLGRTQRAHVYICRDREPWEVMAYVNH